MENNRRWTQKNQTEQNRHQVKRIEVLPDDVLLEIFDFYVDTGVWYTGENKREIEAWQTLVHVCRRWRSLVLGSPRRLNLRLCCTPKTPARDTLDVWPTLPLIVTGDDILLSLAEMDNVIAALEQSDRVCQVDLWLPHGQLGEVLTAMQVPFPELTYLQLALIHETAPVIPDSFLGGSAPRLQSLNFSGIPFTGLPKLLLSATHLVELRLSNIPHSGYIPPKAMVTILSVLPSLRTLHLQFEYPRSHPDWESRSLPPSKRSILPALQKFCFEGDIEYIEELLTRIDTPQLYEMHIYFLDQIDFDCSRLAQFINCTPTLGALDKAYVRFCVWSTSVELLARSGTLEIVILWEGSNRQLSSVAQVCNSIHPLSNVENLYIERRYGERVRRIDAIENTLWLQLLLPFTSVENLYLSEEFGPCIAAALQELVGDRITEVLPNLQNIFVEGLEQSRPLRENFGQFAAARQLSDHPITIINRDIDV